MGLISWLIQRKAKKTLKAASKGALKQDDLNAFVTEYLMRTQKEHADALKTAQSLNKAALLDAQTKKLKTEMRGLLDDEEEEDEEEDEEEEDESALLENTILKNFLPSLFTAKPENLAANIPAGAIESFKKMGPEQQEALFKKMGLADIYDEYLKK